MALVHDECPGAGLREDVPHLVLRPLGVEREVQGTGFHDAEHRGDRAVVPGRQDGDDVAPGQPEPPAQFPCHAEGLAVEVGEGQGARRADDRLGPGGTANPLPEQVQDGGIRIEVPFRRVEPADDVLHVLTHHLVHGRGRPAAVLEPADQAHQVGADAAAEPPRDPSARAADPQCALIAAAQEDGHVVVGRRGPGGAEAHEHVGPRGPAVRRGCPGVGQTPGTVARGGQEVPHLQEHVPEGVCAVEPDDQAGRAGVFGPAEVGSRHVQGDRAATVVAAQQDGHGRDEDVECRAVATAGHPGECVGRLGGQGDVDVLPAGPAVVRRSRERTDVEEPGSVGSSGLGCLRWCAVRRSGPGDQGHDGAFLSGT